MSWEFNDTKYRLFAFDRRPKCQVLFPSSGGEGIKLYLGKSQFHICPSRKDTCHENLLILWMADAEYKDTTPWSFCKDAHIIEIYA